MRNLILIDITTYHDDTSIKNRAIGASEYQCYNLIENLSPHFNIKCYNNKNSAISTDKCNYYPLNSILEEILNDDIIICQRFMPELCGPIYNKIKNNKIYIWMHDLIENHIFIFQRSQEEKKYYSNNELFKDIIDVYYKNININFIFVSNHLKNMFISKFNFEQDRLHVIYNILYDSEFVNIKNQEMLVNKNQITYASAWQKGINHIISLFDYIFKIDNDIILNLLNPGYDWGNHQHYATELKDKYRDRIIIHGPVNKKEYAKIIKQSLCVISTTFNETFGCVFAESYYLGTPVIADYRTGAVKEIIDNNFIVNINDHNSVYNKIVQLQLKREIVNLNNKFLLEEGLNNWLKILSIN